MIKQIQDSYDQYIKVDRSEFAEGEKREIEILILHAKKQLNDKEVVTDSSEGYRIC